MYSYYLQEYRNAQILENLGVGPRIYSSVESSSGRFGYEMEYLPGGFPADVPQFIKTGVTFNSLAQTVKKIQSAGYEIGDLQYFVLPDGTVKIIDTGTMREGLGYFGVADRWKTILKKQKIQLLELLLSP